MKSDGSDKDCFDTVKILNAAAQRGARHLSGIGASGEVAAEMKRIIRSFLLSQIMTWTSPDTSSIPDDTGAREMRGLDAHQHWA